MEKVSITHMSNAHTDWLRGLDFYKQELGILKNRLTEIAGKNTNREVMKEVEHYENQFEIQAENIHKLKHDIKYNVKVAGREAQNSGAGYIDGYLLDQHFYLGERYDSEEKTISELRQSFNQFASTYM
ncbi:MAG: hypothetical protein K0Q79_2478 [Flavipsychrobacter sp.]|nr:hypothetical protein [Flavipsychrobacter sp.]